MICIVGCICAGACESECLGAGRGGGVCAGASTVSYEASALVIVICFIFHLRYKNIDKARTIVPVSNRTSITVTRMIMMTVLEEPIDFRCRDY